MRVHWMQIPLEKESVRMTPITDASYANALKKNLTKDLIKALKLRAMSKKNLIMSCIGVPGSGKSYSMIFIMEKYSEFLGHMPSIDNVCFSIGDMLERIENSDKGEIFILDEQIYQVGIGSGAERMDLINIERVVRAHKLSLFFIAPTYIPHIFHNLLEVFEIGSTHEWDGESNPDLIWECTKNLVFNHKFQILGYTVTWTPENKKFLEKYEERKDKFINEVRMRFGSNRGIWLTEKAYEFLEDSDFFTKYLLAKTKNLKKLLITIHPKRRRITSMELPMLVDYIDYVLNFDDKYKKRVRDKIREIKESEKSKGGNEIEN